MEQSKKQNMCNISVYPTISCYFVHAIFTKPDVKMYAFTNHLIDCNNFIL